MGTHWECLFNHLFVFMMTWVLIDRDVNGTHEECIIDSLFVSIMSIVLITSLVNRLYVFILSRVLIGCVF